MALDRFNNFLTQMNAKGFKLDPRIQQKNVNGLLGMHAAENIPAGTVLASFPEAMKIPVSEHVDFSDDPHSEAHSLIHAMALQIADPDSPFRCYFEYCGTIEDRVDRSVCFFDKEEFEYLRRMNPLLAQMALSSKSMWEHMVSSVSERDPQLSKEHIKLASLIYRERCWGRGLGFLPGLDLFNHNTKSNITPQPVTLDGTACLALIADREYLKGEEIKISYGKKDLFKFAVNYDFFDPDDFHIISYSARITQGISDEFVRKVVDNLGQHYDVNTFELNGQERFAINENHAFFLDRGPNKAMVDLVSRLAVNSDSALKAGHADERSTARYMHYILESFKQANHVRDIDKSSLPDKLHSYYDMLLAELRILEANIQSVLPRCA